MTLSCLRLVGQSTCSLLGPVTPDYCARCPLWETAGQASGLFPPEQPRPAVPAAKPAAQTKTMPKPGTPFTDRDSQPLAIKGLFRGASLFIVASGPSLRTMDLAPLRSRGIITMGVNNSPAVWRPNLWTHGDPSDKFHQSIWRDPAILKIMPCRMFGRNLRVKEDGHFSKTDELCSRQPGVIGYVRNACFNPDTWLAEDSINWGNDKKNAAANRHPHVLNIMFVALKLAYALGFKFVYLLGCDFRMTEGQPIYAFDQGKTPGAVNSNNGSYLKLNAMLNLLQPRFLAADFHVINCTPNSGLLAFPALPLGEAIARATQGIPQDPLDTGGWYDSNEGRTGRPNRRRARQGAK